MTKVSIIVPVYNAIRYLEKCLNCIRNQTLKELEIILVDDGSTDGSAEFCDRSALEDSRIRVLHQPNSGVSAARNAGIEAATGDYIGFSDADDTMEPDMYETLYQTAVDHSSDFTAVGIWVHLLSGRAVKKYGTGQVYEFDNAEAIKWLLINQKYCFSCYCHLIQASLCKSVKFDERYKMHEDRFYTFEILLRARRICCNDVCKYHYILRESSATAGSFTDKKLDVIEIADQMQKVINERYPVDSIYARINCLTSCIDVYKGMMKDPLAKRAYPKREEVHTRICKYRVSMCRPYFSAVRLLELFLMQKLPSFYMLLLQLITKGKKVFYTIRNCFTG